jgi:hypothetical protein
LRRGVVIRGKVTEDGSGKPIAGATLGYVSRSNADSESGDWNSRPNTALDGSYQFAVLPRPGYIMVLGPSEDYAYQEIGERMIREGQPGGRRRWYAHAFIAQDLQTGSKTQEVNITLHRGMTVKGQVVDPQGQPVEDAWMFSRLIALPQPVPWRHWWGEYHGNARDGRFELHGVPRDTEVPVIFLEPQRRLGSIVNIAGKSGSSEPVIVRLEFCGTVKVRLVDPAGKPVAKYHDPYLISMVVTPGPSPQSSDKADEGRLAADQDYLFRIDPINYVDGLVSDGRGCIVFPALIPKVTYRIYDNTTDNDNAGRRLRKEFTVKPGETLDLGDIRIEKPHL